MNKLNKPLVLILSLTFIFLNNCQGIRDNLSLKKKVNSDEFLVQKKSPLVLPPSYGELPLPSEENTNYKEKDNDDIKIVVGNKKLEIDVPIKNSKPTSLEQSVLEKIK